MAIEYAYARVRGRRSRLLSPGDIESIIREDLENLDNLLKETKYARYINEYKGKFPGIEGYIRAFNAFLIDEIGKLEEILADDSFYLRSLRTYISRWDLQNFISIVRGKFYSYPDNEVVMSILPVGFLDDVRVKELLKEEDAYSVVERVKVVFRDLPFAISREALKNLKDGKLANFEYDIYTSFYNRVLSENVHDTIKDFYKYQIDAKNISLAAISLNYGDRPSLWIEGGHLSGDIRRKILQCESLEELKGIILERFGKEIDIGKIDTFLENRFFLDVLKGFRSDPVGFNSILYYLHEVEREVRMLRTIVYAKSFGLEPEQIKEVLYV